MTSRLRVTAVVATLVATGCTGGSDPGADGLHPHLEDWPRTHVEVVAEGGTHPVDALVAATPEQRQRGLQHVEYVPDGVGMLFVFDRERTSGFWMKDTLVPLEIAFAGHDGEIVDVLAMEPCEAEPCTVYTPEEPYRVALEVPDGWLRERDVGPGDRLEWTGEWEAR